MSLPTNITLPINTTEILSGNPTDLYNYLRKLVYVLSTFMQQANQSANGQMTLITNTNNPDYIFITGSTSEGTATYSNCVMWVQRANQMNYVWFDITWTGHTGTGDLLINVPYYSQDSTQFPYVGVIEADNMTFDAGYTYLTGNILPNTNTIQVDENGSGVPILPLALPANGHLRGSIVYAGQQFQ